VRRLPRAPERSKVGNRRRVCVARVVYPLVARRSQRDGTSATQLCAKVAKLKNNPLVEAKSQRHYNNTSREKKKNYPKKVRYVEDVLLA